MGNLAYKSAIFNPEEFEVEDAHVTKAWVADRKRRKVEEREQKIVQFNQMQKKRIQKQLETQRTLGQLSIVCSLISALIGKFYYSDMWLLAFGFGVVGIVMIIAAVQGKIVIY